MLDILDSLTKDCEDKDLIIGPPHTVFSFPTLGHPASAMDSDLIQSAW